MNSFLRVFSLIEIIIRIVLNFGDFGKLLITIPSPTLTLQFLHLPKCYTVRLALRCMIVSNVDKLNDPPSVSAYVEHCSTKVLATYLHSTTDLLLLDCQIVFSCKFHQSLEHHSCCTRTLRIHRTASQ